MHVKINSDFTKIEVYLSLTQINRHAGAITKSLEAWACFHSILPSLRSFLHNLGDLPMFQLLHQCPRQQDGGRAEDGHISRSYIEHFHYVSLIHISDSALLTHKGD